MALDINITTQTDSAVRMSLAGSLDSETYPVLDKALAETLKDTTVLVALDMQDLDFISSAGLRVIFSTLKKVKSRGGRVAVSKMKPGVQKVFEIVKALPDLSVFASEQEMDDYLTNFQK